MNFFLGYCLLSMIFNCCISTPTGFYLEKRAQARKYCGDMLTATLKHMCGDRGYNEMKSAKRSGQRYFGLYGVSFNVRSFTDFEYAYGDQPQDVLEETSFQLLGFPGMTQYETGLQPYGMDEFRRPRRGVVDECCRRACTMKTLFEYCK